MDTNYAELLKRFDPIGIARYNITARDLETIERYIKILQIHLPHNSWDEAVSAAGDYGTSILIHEVTQIRGLMRSGVQPLRYKRVPLQNILRQHIELHVHGIYEEHVYLQDAIARKYGQHFQVATLAKANLTNDADLQYFLESEIGIFLLEEERVEEAREILSRLKGR